ncbi:MAG: alpha/beta fold hydrolase, partial [Bacillota bacterium]|nr:alpha/beta fold hydrolase [Bacillota bacterium]
MEVTGIKPFSLEFSVKNPIYHSDGQKLSFISDFSGFPQIWELDLIVGQLAQTSFTKENIIFVNYIKGGQILIGMDASGNERIQLYLLKSNGQLIPLTNSPDHIHQYGGSSPDGKWIAWSSNRRHPAFFDLYIQNLETLAIHQVFSANGVYSSIQWSPDGKSLLIRKTNSQVDNDLGLLHLETGNVNWLTDHFGEASFKNPHFNKKGDHLYLLTNKDREFFGLASLDLSTKGFTWLEMGEWDYEGLTMNKDKNMLAFSINVGGVSRGVLVELQTTAVYTWETPMGVISDLEFSPGNQKLAFVFNGPLHPPDIWELNLRTLQTERLTNFSRSQILDNQLIKPIPISFKSFDSLPIPALFYKPRNPSGKLPIIVYIHGGPESQSRPVYNPILQYFLRHGYAVCAPNVRGSTGFGKTYTHLDDVRKRMDAVKDLVSLVEWLKTEGNADPGKIAIMGGSYGGFMVLAAITHYPDLWAAAIDIVGISSIRNYLETTSP